MDKRKTPKQIRYDGLNLWKKQNGDTILLGPITTKKGNLTRAQKLKAVANTGEWIEV